MKKYPKIRRIGHPETDGLTVEGEVVIQEKLDGANFRFALEEILDEEYQTDERDLVFGSRNVAYKNEKDVDKAFTHAIEYIRETIDIEALKQMEGSESFVFFGEAMHSHTLEYNWDDVPSFLGFDVWWGEQERFADHGGAERIFEEIGLSTTPVVDVVSDIDVDEFEIPESEYRDGLAEGVVFKNHSTKTYAKLRSEKFLEKHDSAKKHSNNQSDVGKVVGAYITDSRIEKNAHKLVDKGQWDGIQMEMMEELPMMVLQDVFEEEANDILHQNWEIDIGELRSRAAKKCARELRDLMIS